MNQGWTATNHNGTQRAMLIHRTLAILMTLISLSNTFIALDADLQAKTPAENALSCTENASVFFKNTEDQPVLSANFSSHQHVTENCSNSSGDSRHQCHLSHCSFVVRATTTALSTLMVVSSLVPHVSPLTVISLASIQEPPKV